MVDSLCLIEWSSARQRFVQGRQECVFVGETVGIAFHRSNTLRYARADILNRNGEGIHPGVSRRDYQKATVEESAPRSGPLPHSQEKATRPGA